ncbi:MAG: hypothetical protein ACR2IE_12105 [Candidatus Sumerlaeaceae bacterium]
MSASATSTPPEGTTTNVRCPRCHHGNDTDALQCTHCGEMLQKVHYGITNRAAIVRDAIGAPSADHSHIDRNLQYLRDCHRAATSALDHRKQAGYLRPNLFECIRT